MSAYGDVTMLSPAQQDANAEAERVRLEQEEDSLPVRKRRWLGRCPHGNVHYCDLCLAEDVARCYGFHYRHWLALSGCPLKDKDGDELVWFPPKDLKPILYLVPIGGHFELASFDEAERKRKFIDWHKVSVFGMCDSDSRGGFMFHPFGVDMIEEVIFPRMTPKTVADFVAFLKVHFVEWDANPARVERLSKLAEHIVLEEGYPSSDLHAPHPVGHRRSARESARRKRAEARMEVE
jgi:hypothetical protein